MYMGNHRSNTHASRYTNEIIKKEINNEKLEINYIRIHTNQRKGY